jgi:hypothetical protein
MAQFTNKAIGLTLIQINRADVQKPGFFASIGCDLQVLSRNPVPLKLCVSRDQPEKPKKLRHPIGMPQKILLNVMGDDFQIPVSG